MEVVMVNDSNDVLWEKVVAAASLSSGVRAHLSRKAPPDGWAKAPGAFGMATLRVGSHALSMPCAVRMTVSSASVPMLERMAKESRKGLLVVAGHVAAARAETLRRAGISFMDAAGNIYLEQKGKFLILVVGREPHPAEKKLAAGRPRAFHTSGLKFIYALLSDPRLGKDPTGGDLVSLPYREQAKVAGLPHSTVGWIMADLVNQGYVVEAGRGHRLLLNRRKLLERWAQGYAENLRPRLILDRYTPERADWWREARIGNALWTGEVAAAKLTGMLKPGTFALYGDPPTHELVLRHGLQRDPRGTVEFLNLFWMDQAETSPGSECVHPLLVYADLLAIDDDRTREAAQAVYEHHLRPSIETD